MHTVRVTNVSLVATERVLRDFFFFCGAVVCIEMQPGVAYITFKDHQGAENALLCSGTRIGGSAVTVTMTPDHQLSAEALASTVGKEVTIQILCPTRRKGLVLGRNQATINAIRTDTASQVTIRPLFSGFEVVNISAFENIAGHTSPILSAARNVFELCMVSKEGNFELTIFVNGTDIACLDDVALDNFCRATGASILVSHMVSLDAIMVKVMGAQEAVLRASYYVVSRLRSWELNKQS